METVKDVCRETGVTRKRLFYYDRIGLLKPTKRVGPQKTKMYGPKAIERLKLILLYQKAGLRLYEIERILDGDKESKADCLKSALDRLKKQAEEIELQISFAEHLLNTIDEKQNIAE